MACGNTLTSGIALDCFNQVGGIEVAYVTSFSGSALTLVESAGEVSSITIDGVAVTTEAALATDLNVFEVEKQSSTLTETGTFAADAGTAFYTSVASLLFNKMSSEKQEVLSTLGKNKLCVILKDNNGKFWLVGNENGATVSNSTSTTGTAWADRNNMTIEFTGIALNPMYEVVLA